MFALGSLTKSFSQTVVLLTDPSVIHKITELNTVLFSNVEDTIKVAYMDVEDTLKSRQLHDIAKMCSCYIQNFYPRIKLPEILLDMEQSKDTVYYQLGYDNIYGNSIDTSADDDIRQPQTWDYTTLGIRIKSCSPQINKEIILKLLDYGINHVNELKALRKEAGKLDYYDRPDNITLKRRVIKRILRRKKSDKIKFALNNCKFI